MPTSQSVAPGAYVQSGPASTAVLDLPTHTAVTACCCGGGGMEGYISSNLLFFFPLNTLLYIIICLMFAIHTDNLTIGKVSQYCQLPV